MAVKARRKPEWRLPSAYHQASISDAHSTNANVNHNNGFAERTSTYMCLSLATPEPFQDRRSDDNAPNDNLSATTNLATTHLTIADLDVHVHQFDAANHRNKSRPLDDD